MQNSGLYNDWTKTLVFHVFFCSCVQIEILCGFFINNRSYVFKKKHMEKYLAKALNVI